MLFQCLTCHASLRLPQPPPIKPGAPAFVTYQQPQHHTFVKASHPISSCGRLQNNVPPPFHSKHPSLDIYSDVRVGKSASTTSTSLSLYHSADTTAIASATSFLLSSDSSNNAATLLITKKSLAEALGYLIGAASILLYTPIAVRILRTKSADGLTVSTWWLKMISFTCTDVYNIRNGFPFAAFSETFVITLEAAVVLGLVTYYQQRINLNTIALASTYLVITAWALFSPSNDDTAQWISLAQILATILSTSALLPQLKQNFERQESGDYSPITASLASVGCAIRLFTTMELADGDPLILLNYGTALLLNLSVLFQVVYFGTQNEGKSLVNLFLADVKSSATEEDILM